MSGIFGIFRRDHEPAAGTSLAEMQMVMTHWGPDGSDVWLQGCAGLGQSKFISTPEGQFEHLPAWDDTRKLAFTAAARLDNREELLAQLHFVHSARQVPDSGIIYQAYLKWGPECVKQLLGDWSFAVWDPQENKLFLARDHFGNTSLFYCITDQVMAFASDSASLMKLALIPKTLDEMVLAQVLISWPAYHGEKTIIPGLKRLPPAHTLTVTSGRADLNNYWNMEDVTPLRLPSPRDYVEPFREIIEKSVRSRLRHPEPAAGNNGLAVTLSGGLDSSTITMTAAKILRQTGQRMSAFTSIPLYSQSSDLISHRFGNELPYAQASASRAGNVDLFTIDAAGVSIIQSIRRSLKIHHEPGHAAGNFYWLQILMEKASADGLRVLLTGQLGNGALSWSGDKLSQSLLFQLKNMTLQKWAKEHLKRILPASMMAAGRQIASPADWVRRTSLRPDVAKRLNILELRHRDLFDNPVSALQQRYQLLKPGKNYVGAIHAQNGAAFGLDIRDPSADTRLLQFSLSVPDKVFMDPRTGMDRWLIREAMEGILPDEIRLNRRRGLQAVDIILRMRACAPEVEQALSEIESGSGSQYVDVPYMRDVWQMVKTVENPSVTVKCQTILTRGIMAGLWVSENFA